VLTVSYPTEVGNYCSIYESLASAINANDQSKFIVSPEEAILNIRLIEAGLQSSKERRTIDIE
jgi:predicted dehydrogenase